MTRTRWELQWEETPNTKRIRDAFEVEELWNGEGCYSCQKRKFCPKHTPEKQAIERLVKEANERKLKA